MINRVLMQELDRVSTRASQCLRIVDMLSDVVRELDEQVGVGSCMLTANAELTSVPLRVVLQIQTIVASRA